MTNRELFVELFKQPGFVTIVVAIITAFWGFITKNREHKLKMDQLKTEIKLSEYKQALAELCEIIKKTKIDMETEFTRNDSVVMMIEEEIDLALGKDCAIIFDGFLDKFSFLMTPSDIKEIMTQRSVHDVVFSEIQEKKHELIGDKKNKNEILKLKQQFRMLQFHVNLSTYEFIRTTFTKEMRNLLK